MLMRCGVPLPIGPLAAARLLVADYAGTLTDVVEKLDVDGVQSTIIQINGTKILLIRGTDQASDWLRYNFQFLPSAQPGDRYQWHGGFLKHAQIAYAFAKNKDIALVIGHSLGAAAAGIVAVSLGIYGLTFATPRALFGAEVPPGSSKVLNYCRVDDLVTMVPPSFLGFAHCGQVCWLDPKGRHVGEDHRLLHYIELLELMEAVEATGAADDGNSGEIG